MTGQSQRERILIRAARLRVTCDRKLGHTTPTWVIELAQRELEPFSSTACSAQLNNDQN